MPKSSERTRLFLLSTVPSTGTRFCTTLLFGSSIARIRVRRGPVFDSPVDGVERQLKVAEKSLPETTEICCVVSHLKMRQHFLGLHRAGILRPGVDDLRASLSADDCSDLGIRAKMVAPLRHPLLGAMTAIHSQHKHPARFNALLSWRHDGLTWMARHWAAHSDDVRLIPIDLMGEWKAGAREAYLHPILEGFLGISCGAMNAKMLSSWTPRNEQTSLPSWPDDWVQTRQAIMRGEDVRGWNPLLDREIDYYLARGEVLDMFRAHGYTGFLF